MANPGLFFFSGKHAECVVPYVDISLHRGQFWTIQGCPGGLFQLSGGGDIRIIFASASSSIRAICPNMERRRDWIIAVRLVCLGILLALSFQTNWCHLIESSVLHWSGASILCASILAIAQHSDSYRKIARIQVLYNFSWMLKQLQVCAIWQINTACNSRIIALFRLMASWASSWLAKSTSASPDGRPSLLYWIQMLTHVRGRKNCQWHEHISSNVLVWPQSKALIGTGPLRPRQ